MIYFIGQGDDYVKIGYTKGSVAHRLTSIQTGNPHELKLLLTLEGGRKAEYSYHSTFAPYHVRGEWYHLSKEIAAFIKQWSGDKREVSSFITDNYNKLELLRARR